jgi:hypothetical protein
VHAEVDAAELVREASDAAGRPSRRATAAGLNSRTSTFGIVAKTADRARPSLPVVVVRRRARRTRTTRPAASRRLAHELQADAVGGELVVLDVERALGAARQGEPGVEGEVAGRQQAKARFARAAPARLAAARRPSGGVRRVGRRAGRRLGGGGGRLAQPPAPAPSSTAATNAARGRTKRDSNGSCEARRTVVRRRIIRASAE